MGTLGKVIVEVADGGLRDFGAFGRRDLRVRQRGGGPKCFAPRPWGTVAWSAMRASGACARPNACPWSSSPRSAGTPGLPAAVASLRVGTSA
eukprot:1890587-Alexandrium_andersonii.AAC.1